MGKGARAFYKRELKGQKRELLEAVEDDKFGGDMKLAARQAALDKAAAAPKIPVVSKIKHKESTRSGGAMDVDGQEVPRRQPTGEEKLRRVLSVTGCGVTKRHRDSKKNLSQFLPVQPNKAKERALKKALKRGAPKASDAE